MDLTELTDVRLEIMANIGFDAEVHLENGTKEIEETVCQHLKNLAALQEELQGILSDINQTTNDSLRELRAKIIKFYFDDVYHKQYEPWKPNRIQLTVEEQKYLDFQVDGDSQKEALGRLEWEDDDDQEDIYTEDDSDNGYVVCSKTLPAAPNIPHKKKLKINDFATKMFAR